MPILSDFTPCGFLELADEPSEGEKVYNALVDMLGGNVSIDDGTYMDGWTYATAMAIGEARLTLIHAGLQISPQNVDEMLGNREAEWQIIPGPNDSLWQRRDVLAARMKIPRGARREAVEDALRTLLGPAFIWYYTCKASDIQTWPPNLGDQPQNLQLPTVQRTRVTITQPITTSIGNPQDVTFAYFDATQAPLLVGDKLVVDPEFIARTETVTILALDTVAGTLRAVFDKPHNTNITGTTAPYPMWSSNQRFDLVITTPSAAIDPETRRKVNELLEKVLRAVTCWGVVQATDTNSAGPFLCGVSPLGVTCFGLVTFP